MSSEGQQDPPSPGVTAPGGRARALDRLRAVLAAPTFITRWRRRQHPTDDAPCATPVSTRTFSLEDDDEPRGEVTLYPLYIDSESSSENSTPETPSPSVEHSPSANLSNNPKTLVEAEFEANTHSLTLHGEEEVMTSTTMIKKPQKRLLVVGPAAPVAAVVVRCVCWMLAQRLVRQFLEKAVGASQRWLFTNVCSRRTRVAVIGVASILWGMLVGAVSICALFVIISGDLESVIEEAAQLGEWCDAIATTAAASFLALHVAQVLFGALLVAASKVTGYRAPEENGMLMEKLLLALFELMKIDITLPPPAPCNHEPPSPSSSLASSPRGSVCSGDRIRGDGRDVSPRPCGSKDEHPRPSHTYSPMPLPTHSSEGGYMGWVRPEEKEMENEGHNWPELPGNWRAPHFSQTAVSNPNNSAFEASHQAPPYPLPCDTNAFWPGTSDTSQAGTSKLPYPVPNHVPHMVPNNLPYPVPNYCSNAVVRDPPYPEHSIIPNPVSSTFSGGQDSIGFQTPPGGSRQTSAVEISNYSFKVRILKRQVPRDQERPSAEDEESEQRTGPSPVPHLLMPWLYTAWMTLGMYALLSTGLAAIGRGAVAAAVGAVELPAVACVVDVFAELRGVPESCGCKKDRASSKEKKEKKEKNVNFRSMTSPDAAPVYDETSPLLH